MIGQSDCFGFRNLTREHQGADYHFRTEGLLYSNRNYNLRSSSKAHEGKSKFDEVLSSRFKSNVKEIPQTEQNGAFFSLSLPHSPFRFS